jgi:hypothetical protein
MGCLMRPFLALFCAAKSHPCMGFYAYVVVADFFFVYAHAVVVDDSVIRGCVDLEQPCSNQLLAGQSEIDIH